MSLSWWSGSPGGGGGAPTFPLLADAGTVGAPSYAFSGASSNTGFYLPGADQVGLAINGVRRTMWEAQITYFGSLNVDDNYLFLYGTSRPYMEFVKGNNASNWRIGIDPMLSGITGDSYVIGSHGFKNFELGYASDAAYIRYGFSRSGNPMASLGGSILYSTTAVGNITADEDNLISVTTGDAKPLGRNGDYYKIIAFGTFAANGNTKTVKLYLGSTVIATITGAMNAGGWHIEATVIRTGAATQLCSAIVSATDTTFVTKAIYTSGAENNDAAQTIKCTGQSGSDATDDVIQTAMIVQWYSSAPNS